MSWLRLELDTQQQHSEALSDLLEQFGAVSVSLSALSDEPVFDQHDQSRTLWDQIRLSALLHPDTDLDILLACLEGRIGAENIHHHHIEMLKDRDWVGEFQASHQPLVFSNRICISPSWVEAPDNDFPTITLEPSLAFGTGSHPSTVLCIKWLAVHDVINKTVIDYGCGSGILAMVAAKLGAKQVYAVDIDPQAVAAAKENCEQNRLSAIIEVGQVNELLLPAVNILVANILMNPLKELKSIFHRCLVEQGELVLSGLLNVQAKECLVDYASCFTMEALVFEAEWARLQGKKNQLYVYHLPEML